MVARKVAIHSQWTPRMQAFFALTHNGCIYMCVFLKIIRNFRRINKTSFGIRTGESISKDFFHIIANFLRIYFYFLGTVLDQIFHE